MLIADTCGFLTDLFIRRLQKHKPHLSLAFHLGKRFTAIHIKQEDTEAQIGHTTSKTDLILESAKKKRKEKRMTQHFC